MVHWCFSTVHCVKLSHKLIRRVLYLIRISVLGHWPQFYHQYVFFFINIAWVWFAALQILLFSSSPHICSLGKQKSPEKTSTHFNVLSRYISVVCLYRGQVVIPMVTTQVFYLSSLLPNLYKSLKTYNGLPCKFSFGLENWDCHVEWQQSSLINS